MIDYLKPKKLKEQNGALIVEATIVYPIVMVILCGFIIMGLYIMQGILYYSSAQKVADFSAKMLIYPGYDTMGSVREDKLGFVSVHEDYNSTGLETKPYRYWDNRFAKKSEMLQALEKNVRNSALLKTTTPECKIEYKRSVFDTHVKVTLRYQYQFPGFLRLIGLSKAAEREITAVSDACDPPEFIRNTDFAADLVMDISDKLGITGKVQEIMNKVSDFKNKYF